MHPDGKELQSSIHPVGEKMQVWHAAHPTHGMADQRCNNVYVKRKIPVCMVAGLQGEVLARWAPPHPSRAFSADRAMAQAGESILLS